MFDELAPPVRHGYDLNLVNGVLLRVCVDDDEVAALKRVLGLDRQEVLASDAYAPQPPPAPVGGSQFDHVQRTRDAIVKYSAWVASFPDDDPTTLLERERILRLAQLDLDRLTGE